MFHNHRKSQALVFYYTLFYLCNVCYVRGTNCHCAWMEGPQYCYWLSEEYNDKKSWYDSKIRCEAKGSVLGIVYSDTEKEWLKQQILTREFHWMGYTQMSTDDFRYIVTNQTDTFIRNFSPVKGSKEEVRQDCAGVEKQSSSNDIWWRDKKCCEKRFYICIAHKVTSNQSTTTKTSTVSTTKTSQTTETVPVIQSYLADTQRHKAKKPVTVPMSRDPVHVVAGTSAIIILVAVVAFIVGNDMTTLLCKITFCSPEKKKLVKPKTKLKSFVFNYSWQADTTGHDVNFWIFLKSYESYIDVNGRITEFDEEAFQNAFIVQNGSKTDVWIKHMSLNLSKVDETGSTHNGTGKSVDDQPHNDPTILRVLNQAQTSTKEKCPLLDQLVANKTLEKLLERSIKDRVCDNSSKSCKPLDTPVVATYVDPASKTAIKASYIGSTNSQNQEFDKSKVSDVNYHSIQHENQSSPYEDTKNNSIFNQLKGDSSSCLSMVNFDGFLFSETTNSIRDCVVENLDVDLGRSQSDVHDKSGYCDVLQSEKSYL